MLTVLRLKEDKLMASKGEIKIRKCLADYSLLSNIDEDEFFELVFKKYTFSRKLLSELMEEAK